MAAAATRKATETPTTIPAIAPAFRPLDSDGGGFGELDGLLEEAEAILWLASLSKTDPEREEQTAVRKVCNLQKGRDLRGEVVYVCSKVLLVISSTDEIPVVLLTHWIASRTASPPRTARTAERQQ